MPENNVEVRDNKLNRRRESAEDRYVENKGNAKGGRGSLPRGATTRQRSPQRPQ